MKTFLIAIALLLASTFARAACPKLPDELNFSQIEYVILHISGKYKLQIDFPNMKTTATCDDNGTITFDENAQGKLTTVNNRNRDLGISLTVAKAFFYQDNDEWELTITQAAAVDGLPDRIAILYTPSTKKYSDPYSGYVGTSLVNVKHW